jgi:hypothetical protein
MAARIVMSGATLVGRSPGTAARDMCFRWPRRIIDACILRPPDTNCEKSNPMTMITFGPDMQDAASSEPIETALFLGVRRDPPLESTQLRWQVKTSALETVQLESGHVLESLGGALFVTTKEPKLEVADGELPAPVGWIRWIGDSGRRSFQIQLAISRVGFDRLCDLAQRGRYPHAILTFAEDGSIGALSEAQSEVKIWKNVEAKKVLIDEYTFRYDFTRGLNAA